MAELRLNIIECKYPNIVQDELMKDQFIFWCLCLLGEITPEDNSDKCLLDAHKVESKIKQCKLLGIKTSMTYDAIHSNNNNRGRSKFRNKKSGMWSVPKVPLEVASIVGKSHNQGTCPTFGKECSKCGKKNHFKAVCKSGSNDR